MTEFKNSSSFISTGSHKQILPDCEDLITSLRITCSNSQYFSKSSSFSRLCHKPVRQLTNVLNVVAPSVNFHGFFI